jgi:glycerophosphoryl diester phosphodiesterase
VREADAGFWYSIDGGRTHPFRGRGLQVPSLAEMLDRWPAARINIDAKDDRTMRPLVDLLRRRGAFERVCIGSFSDRRLAQVRALTRGGVCTSMGRAAAAATFIASRTGHVPALGADCVQVPPTWRGVNVVDARFVSSVHRAGLPVHVWTINDEPTMARLLDLGVDGVMTDRPRLLRSLLNGRGQWPGSGAWDAPLGARHNDA